MEQHEMRVDVDVEKVHTSPIPIITPALKLPPSIPVRSFELLSPEELSPEDVLDIRKQITAIVYAQRILDKKQAVEAPDPYEERFYIWKMLFQQFVLLGALVAVVAVIVALGSFDAFSGISTSIASLAVLIIVLLYLWAAYRTLYSWQHTYFFSELEGTGIRRPRQRWLLLNEIDLAVATSSLQTKDATRGNFTSFFNLNCWRVTLDSPSQKDKFLDDVRFVRDGDRLKKTVQSIQHYLNHTGR